MANWLRLRRQSHAPREFDGTETIYAAADGTLMHMDPDGSETELAGAGSLPSPTSEGDVLTVVDGDWAGEAPSGGSQTWEVTPIAFDTPDLNTQAFSITAVTQDNGDSQGVVTIAGSHADLFPVDSAAAIAGSSGNDGTYTVVLVTEGGGNTVVTLGSTLGDPTADGDLCNVGTAGVAVATLADGDLAIIKLLPVSVKTAWDGTSPTLSFTPSIPQFRAQNVIGSPADLSAADTYFQSNSASLLQVVLYRDPQETDVFRATGDVSIIAFAAQPSGAPHGSTAGEGEVAIQVVRA